MGVAASLVVVLLSGVAGLLAGGLVALRAVSWYRISSFEGKSGYFVVAMAILGLGIGSVIGFVATRVAVGGTEPTLPRSLGLALAVVALLSMVIGVTARLLADVPPELDGQTLRLEIEVGWPPGAEPPLPPSPLGWARLGRADSTGTIRRSSEGPLFLDQARRDADGWVAAGAAPIFTARGRPILEVGIGDESLAAFRVALPGRPGPKERTWSDWLPPTPPAGLRCRFRVALTSEALRVDRLGPFVVETIAESFYHVGASRRLAASSHFRVALGETRLPEFAEAGAVALVGGPSPALLVQIAAGDDGPRCELVAVEAGVLHRRPLGPCAAPIAGDPLTADPQRRRVAAALDTVPGWIDTETFAIPGLYEVAHGVLDTRDGTFRPLTEPDGPWRINGLPSATLSPDQHSFVWFTQDVDSGAPLLGVTEWKADRWSTVAIDRARMRFNDPAEIGPEWVAHHFEWQHREGGVDQLTPRADFVPLPYRGVRILGADGRLTFYTLRPGGTALREAMLARLVADLGAEPLADELDGYYRVLQVDGKPVKVSLGSDGVTFTMDFGTVDSDLMLRLVDHLDSVIAAGRHDALFHSDS